MTVSFPLFFRVGLSRHDGVEMVLEGIELAVPVPGQRGQELLRHLHGGGAKPVAHPAPLPGSAATSPASASSARCLAMA